MNSGMYLERESKWSIAPAAVLPSFDDITDGVQPEVETLELENSYYDTAEHDLLAHGITLRFRRGDEAETGWQAKIPQPNSVTDEETTSARQELHVNADAAAAVPAELADPLWGARLGKPLSLVAIISTHRTRHRYRGTDGKVLFDLDDDSVSATVVGPTATARSWREVEIELGHAAPTVVRAVQQRLRTAGAEPSPDPSKLAHALGYTAASPVHAETRTCRDLGAAVAAQIAAFFHADLQIRRDDDGFAQQLTAVEYLSAAVQLGDHVLETDDHATIVADLAWLRGLLRAVRHQRAQSKLLDEAVATLGDQLVLGPVRARVSSEMAARERDHRTALHQAMQSSRYQNTLTMLSNWSRRSPVNHALTGKVLRKRVNRLARAAEDRLVTALTTPDDSEIRDGYEALLSARYASDMTARLVDKKNRRKMRKSHKNIHEALAAWDLATSTADLLRRLGTRAGTVEGENGFTYGLLYQQQRDTAGRIIEQLATQTARR
ncbi:CYTH and CHAD domain-containing protein [Skermania sp. ID1734]|uniref:CYTH and CHAD domain-containing protein n=1 Tax=Skermania sp. ID1734 TaxID=2597516 RepID=UPI00117DB194|nr:CYTH and CHAD domain-containing protein [Skermania sp. ID1734]TSE01546.1 CYTH and CHAD domain-containing protein [Skermania sp. ID1734]